MGVTVLLNAFRSEGERSILGNKTIMKKKTYPISISSQCETVGFETIILKNP